MKQLLNIAPMKLANSILAYIDLTEIACGLKNVLEHTGQTIDHFCILGIELGLACIDHPR